MPDEFQFKSPSLRQYRKWLRVLGPKQFRHAIAGLLNAQAWDMKKNTIPDVMTDNMNIRDPGFMNRMLRVKNARPGDMSSMQAVVGSATIGKFKGWEEQQTGMRPAKNRVHTLMSQVGGTERGKISPMNRLTQNQNIIEPLKIEHKHAKTEGQKTTAALIGMRTGRIKSNRLVRLRSRGFKGKLSRLKSGIYRGIRKQVMRIWNFEKAQTTRKIPWMTEAVADHKRRFNRSKEFKKQVKRQFNFMR
jgi:hypothetical protein